MRWLLVIALCCVAFGENLDGHEVKIAKVPVNLLENVEGHQVKIAKPQESVNEIDESNKVINTILGNIEGQDVKIAKLQEFLREKNNYETHHYKPRAFLRENLEGHHVKIAQLQEVLIENDDSHKVKIAIQENVEGHEVKIAKPQEFLRGNAEGHEIKIAKPRELLRENAESQKVKIAEPQEVLKDRSLVHQPGRIVGGDQVGIESYPMLVSLQYVEANDRFFHSCGGSIITPTEVMTAAHCQPPTLLLPTLRARAGSTDNQLGGQLRSVNQWINHPEYQRDILDYDVALLTVDSPFVFNNVVQPVTLAVGPEAIDGSRVAVAGWGRISESAGSERYLRHVSLPVVNRATCTETYSFLTPRQVCYGGSPFGSQSACVGDSGGPCIQSGLQYGLVSGGLSCHAPNVPGVYANLPALLSWVQDNSNYSQ